MSLVAELKRRNVFKVSIAYLALGWVVTEVSNTVVPLLNLPQSIPAILLWIGLAGFPFVLVFSWVYELTPEGLKRESEVDRSQSITGFTSKRLDYLIIGLLVLAMLMFAVDRFVPDNADAAGTDPVRDSSQDASPNADRGQGPLPGEANPAQEVAAAAPDEKSIAVLPFVNMSSDQEQEYFSDGIAEELLNLLAKIPQLKVIARTSSFAFKGKEANIAEIASTLNVAHVLEGSVRKAGNKVRITAQLIRTADSVHLWSETYDRPLDDIFAVRDEIAGAVVEQLRIKLLGAAPKARVVDPQAYALYLQGRELTRQGTAEGYKQGLVLYQQALAIDPLNVAAWTGVTLIYSGQAGTGLRPVEQGYQLARAAVDKALAIDPEHAPALAVLATIKSSFEGDLAGAARLIERALQIDPADPAILSAASSVADRLVRLDASIALMEFSVARDPLASLRHSGLATTYVFAGRYDDAIARYRLALELSPESHGMRHSLGNALLLRGDAEAALAETELETDEGWRLIGLSAVLHTLGRTAEADAALAELMQKYAADSAFNIAYVLAWRGEADRAFEWLDKAIEYKDPGLADIAVYRMLYGLHDDPRWLPFLRKLDKAPEQLAAIEFDIKLPQQ